MWKLIKWLIFLGIIAAIALAITGKRIRGKTIEEHLDPILQSEIVKEGIRDIRALVGEGLKAAGEAVSEDVTDEERKQLDDLLRKELKGGSPVEMPAGQQVLPPDVQKGTTVRSGGPGRPSVRAMEAMPPTESERNTDKVQERDIGDR